MFQIKGQDLIKSFLVYTKKVNICEAVFLTFGKEALNMSEDAVLEKEL